MTLEKGSKRESYRERVNRMFTRLEQSRAYAEFCRRVSGKNLYQVSMVDMIQLRQLLSILRLSKSSRVLDLGCGIGGISEYVSDITGAHVTGLDFAEKVIERAQARTRKKRERLTFKIGDIGNPPFQEQSFDTVIAIDSLYFVRDLERAIRRVKFLLTPKGQMGILYSQGVKPEEPISLLRPRGTRLGRVLAKLKLEFRTWDYTRREMSHWNKRREVALDMKSAFKAEGNLRVCKELVKEAEYALKFVGCRRIRRYLYHVQNVGTTENCGRRELFLNGETIESTTKSMRKRKFTVLDFGNLLRRKDLSLGRLLGSEWGQSSTSYIGIDE